MSRLRNYRRKMNDLLAEHRQAKAAVVEEKRTLAGCEGKARSAAEAHNVLQQVAQAVQEAAHEKISGVVSRCLSAVFRDPYEFKILFEKKRGRTEARLVFIRRGNEVDPISEGGLGVVDVAALAMRVACLVMHKPPLRKLLVLDEPFRWVSKRNLPAVRDLVLTLSKEMGVQFIIVTHEEELQCGKVIRIGE